MAAKYRPDPNHLDMLGQGKYAAVYAALGPDGQRVALKRIVLMNPGFNENAQRVWLKRILREIILLRKCRHPSLVALRDIEEPANAEIHDVRLIFECVSGSVHFFQ